MSTMNDAEKGARAHHEYGYSGQSEPVRLANGTGGLRNIGNPGPLGLSAFALTTFVLSLVSPSFPTMALTSSHAFLD